MKNKMTNQYIIFKTKPFSGYKMEEKVFLGKQVVAIPEKKLHEAKNSSKDLCVIDKTKSNLSYMIFKGDEIAESFAKFPDKYGRHGDEAYYTLCYFGWNPVSQSTLF
jgi:hypothetical protein